MNKSLRVDPMKEEYAIVLDYLKRGHTYQVRSYPIAQVIGEKTFVLLEVIPHQNVDLKSMQRVYIGDGKREHVRSIMGRIPSTKLTANAKAELEYAIKDIVQRREQDFVEFFNKSEAITTKQHQLELLPGIGKKHMWEILEERRKEAFKSFEDIKQRVPSIGDPVNAIVKRILKEIEEDVKWRLFVKQPESSRRRGFRRGFRR